MLPGLSMLYDNLGITRKAGAPVPPVRTPKSRPSRACLADCDANVRGGGAGRIAFSESAPFDSILITIPGCHEGEGGGWSARAEIDEEVRIDTSCGRVAAVATGGKVCEDLP